MTTQFGIYKTQLSKEIRQQIFASDELASVAITVHQEAQNGNEILVPHLELGEVVQPYQFDVTPKGDMNFNGHKVIQRAWKIEQIYDAAKLKGDWIGVNGYDGDMLWDESNNAADPYKIAGNIILALRNRINHDRVTQIFYKGVWTAPTVGTAGTSLQTCDGLETHFNALVGITGGIPAANILAVGAVPLLPADLIEYVKDFVNLIPPIVRMYPMQILCSQEFFTSLMSAYKNEAKYAGQYPTNGTVELYPNITFKPLVSMFGKNRLIATIDRNIFRIINKNDGATNLGLHPQNNPRQVLLVTTFHECYTVGNPNYLYMSDQT